MVAQIKAAGIAGKFLFRCLLILGVFAGATGYAAAPMTFLHTEGQDIVNEKGEKIMLRGVGLGNWMLPEGYMWRFGEQGDRPRKIEKIVSDLIGPENAAKFWKEYRARIHRAGGHPADRATGLSIPCGPRLNPGCFCPKAKTRFIQDEGFALLDNLVKWCKRMAFM